eukprot:1063468-Amphidinium_carterae.1
MVNFHGNGRKACYQGPTEPIVQALITHISRPDQVRYHEKSHAKLNRKLLKPLAPLLQELRLLSPSLSFTQWQMHEGLSQMCALSWWCKETWAPTWAKVTCNMLRTACRHVQQSTLKAKAKRSTPQWLQLLLGEEVVGREPCLSKEAAAVDSAMAKVLLVVLDEFGSQPEVAKDIAMLSFASGGGNVVLDVS